MNKFIKLFWLLSMIGFLALLLWVYANMPPQIDISMVNSAFSEITISKNAFFYSMIAIVVSTNGSILMLSKVLQLLTARHLKENDGFYPQEGHNNRLINWLGSFSIILNLFCIIGVLFVGLYNTIEKEAGHPYIYIVYTSLFLMLVWLLGLIYIIASKRKGMKERLK